MLAADFAIQDKATVQAISDPIEALVPKVVNVYEYWLHLRLEPSPQNTRASERL